MSAIKGNSPRNLGVHTSSPYRSKASSTTRSILNQTFRSPLREHLKKGIRISIGDRYSSNLISKNLSPNRSFLPIIGTELSSTINSGISSSHKLNLSLPGNPTMSDVETPRSKILPSSLRTPRGNIYTSQPSQVHETLKWPITPEVALKTFAGVLTPVEKTEINSYSQVYYIGQKAHKVQPDATTYNSGYDDDKGYYKVVLSDHIAYRFEVIQVIGRGSFGQVLRCLDHKRNTLVALKIIRNKKRFHRQAAIEVKVLQQLRDNDIEDKANAVHFKQYFHFRRHLVIIFELLSIDLYEFIKLNGFKGVSIGLIRRFAVQILNCLKFLREQRVVHCDLKPENILLRKPNRSGLKVIDFGSACFENEQLYSYIQSRFYRAPEVMLGIPYTYAIDMWSFGCILSELFTGVPMFPGESEQDQFLYIMEVLGVPPRMLLDKGTRTAVFFNDDYEPLSLSTPKGSMRPPGSKNLAIKIGCTDTSFVSFLLNCFTWNPEDRWSPEAALQHSWITDGVSRLDVNDKLMP
mmetsp:Transcript_7792/g.14939  ORF Transcript_7792/g.14939 Transcript_7792/m.14939 type:complete len:520 (-) Transcript_7792:261-1820(-)